MRWVLGFVVRLFGTIVILTLGIFTAVEISIPGGQRAVMFPNGFPPEGQRSPRAQAVIDEFNLDHNMFMRWVHWVGDALQGDFGRSDNRAGTAVLELITPRLSISLQLLLFGTLLMVFVGVPLGAFAAARAGRISGTLADTLAGIFQSVPVFITPIFLVWLFALELRWLPAAGWVRISDSLTGNLKAIALPTIALAFAEIGFVARVIRSDITKILQFDYITAAVAKGLSPMYVLFRHALRPASLGVLNVIALNIGALVSGTFVLELIFGIGGMGSLFLGSLVNRDLNLILGGTVYIVTVYVVLNAIADALMHAADPRIRHQ